MTKSTGSMANAGAAVEVPATPEPPWELEATEPQQVLGWDPRAEAAVLGSAAAPPPELARLLRYLQVTYETFAPAEARYFGALSDHLRRAGAIGDGEQLDRATFEAAVRRHQRSVGLSEDGIPGQDFCWALQRDWATARELPVLRVEADRVGGSDGAGEFWIRSDLASDYQAMRAEVRDAGGVVTSAGGFRGLGAAVTPGRSRTSLHYAGLAIDLATDTGMQDPGRDAYLVEVDGSKWRVWCRSDAAPLRELDAIVCRSGAAESHRVSARAFDLTAIAERHGFARIGPRSSFPVDYMAAEWWHFQYERALVPWLSQFGIELLSLASVRWGGKTYVYDEAHLSDYDLWSSRQRMFRRVKDGWW